MKNAMCAQKEANDFISVICQANIYIEIVNIHYTTSLIYDTGHLQFTARAPLVCTVDSVHAKDYESAAMSSFSTFNFIFKLLRICLCLLWLIRMLLI